MEKFTLPAPALRACMYCQAKGDERYYLNGIHINNERMAATDGHRLFVCYSDAWEDSFKAKFPTEGLIISLDAPVPLSAFYAEFTCYSDTLGICEFMKGDREFIKRCTFSLIDGQFPDINRVLPKGSRKAVTNIGFNANYLADIGKVMGCMNRKWPTAKLDFYGEYTGASCSGKSPDFGEFRYVIMPMSL